MGNNEKLSPDVIFLDRNENNYGPAPKCFEVIKDVDFKRFSWYSRAFEKQIKGDLSYRLSKDYKLSEKQVVLGYGGEDLLKQVVHCYLNDGDTLLVPKYSWWYYKSIAAEVGGKSSEFPLYAGEESYHYDIDGLLKMYDKEKPKIILISSPNNPTGNTLEIDEIKQILDHTKNSVVVLDEAYAMFKTSDYTYVTELINEYPNLMIIRTFSKYYALAGIRIGFALIGKGLDQFEKFSSRYLGFNRLNEIIALAALDSAEYYAGITAQMNVDKEMFWREFKMLPGFKPFKSDANFMLVEMNKEQMPQLKSFLNERGLIIKFMAEEELNSQLRITIGKHEENIKLMKAIKEFVSGSV